MFIFGTLLGSCGGAEPKRPVVSEAEVKPQAEAAFAAFVASARIETRETVFDVRCTVNGYEVTLSGKTSDPSLKDAAIKAVSSVQGARVADQISVLPARDLAERTFGIVKVPVLNLGDAPGRAGGSHTVTQARMGDVLRLLEMDKGSGWYLAQMDDGYLGWVDPAAVYVCDKSQLDAFRKAPVALISAKTLPALKVPGGETAFTLVQGTVLPLVRKDGEWATLRLPGAGEVSVQASGVIEYDSPDEVFAEKRGADAVIATAKQFVGLPYLWGGTTALGFDCSGLVQYCFKMNGYRLRRDADLQYQQGEPVPNRASLRPGDLVFFQTYKEGPSHVGIYIGDSKYIQSGSSGLSILSFNTADPDYSASLDKAYLGARRIIK